MLKRLFNIYDWYFEFRSGKLYLIYTQKYWNKIDCCYLKVTKFIKIF